MKLNELYAKPIKEVVAEMEMVDMKVHTDEAGNVRTIEIKYSGESEETEETHGRKPYF